MFDEADDIVLLGEVDEVVVMVEKLHGRLCDEDVDTTFYRVLRDRVVSGCDIASMKLLMVQTIVRTVWSEYDGGITRGELLDSFFVCGHCELRHLLR